MKKKVETDSIEKLEAAKLSTIFCVVTILIVISSYFWVTKWTCSKLGAVLQFIGVSFLFLESTLKLWIDPNKDIKTIFNAVSSTPGPDLTPENTDHLSTQEQIVLLWQSFKSLASLVHGGIAVILTFQILRWANMVAWIFTVAGFVLSTIG